MVRAGVQIKRNSLSGKPDVSLIEVARCASCYSEIHTGGQNESSARLITRLCSKMIRSTRYFDIRSLRGTDSIKINRLGHKIRMY